MSQWWRKRAPPPEPVVSLDEAKQSVTSHADNLNNEIARLQDEIQRLASMRRDPRNASRASSIDAQLRQKISRRRTLEQHLRVCEQQQQNIERVAAQRERQAMDREMIDIMKVTNAAIRQESQGLKPEDFEQVLDDMEDASQELDDIRGVFECFGSSAEDAELDAEVAELMAQAGGGVEQAARPARPAQQPALRPAQRAAAPVAPPAARPAERVAVRSGASSDSWVVGPPREAYPNLGDD